MVALPGLTDEADPVVPVPVAVNAAASEVLHVRLTPVIAVFDESTTVAVMFFAPLCSINEVWVVFSTVRAMDLTGQVMNCAVGLFTPAAVTKTPVIPGLTAVTRACAGERPLAEVETVATS